MPESDDHRWLPTNDDLDRNVTEEKVITSYHDGRKILLEQISFVEIFLAKLQHQIVWAVSL